MDFILSLTHFCEVHGPKSVLCTQVLPLECALCLPPSPTLHPKSSADSLTTEVHAATASAYSSHPPSLKKTDTNLTLPTDFSGASTTIDSEPCSPIIERHPLFRSTDQKKDIGPQFRYGRAQGDTCASCSFSVPQEVADKLPAGAPGSVKADGKSKNGAPVLRSREFVCMAGNEQSSSSQTSKSDHELNPIHESKASSYESFASCHSDCHDHLLTYLTAKSPDDPESYSLLRASVIRTLSYELLPRGMSDGPFCFGDANAGYTIAYMFRLTDPKARGRRRAYAFLALAGKDTSRAFRACPMVWEAFAIMARGIESAAQRHQEEQRRKEEEEKDKENEAAKTRSYTPVSSFLTQRTNDPDGHPRRAGQVSPRSLAEIVGDENIFAILHQYFVTVLRCLGEKFGGLPFADRPSIYQTMADDHGIGDGKVPAKVHAELVSNASIKVNANEDTASTPKAALAPLDDIDAAKEKVNRSIQRNSQCAPLAVSTTAQRQVVM